MFCADIYSFEVEVPKPVLGRLTDDRSQGWHPRVIEPGSQATGSTKLLLLRVDDRCWLAVDEERA